MIVLDQEGQEDKKTVSPAHKRVAEQLDPPPLYPSTSSSRQASTSRSLSTDGAQKPLPRIPPPPPSSTTRNLEIIRSEDPIKGSWTVDTTSFPLDGPLSSPSPEVRPNLRLLSHQGGVDATLKLKGSHRAVIEAICNDGPVSVNVVDRGDTPFFVLVTANNGDTRIHLPRSFYGPIRCRWRLPEVGPGYTRRSHSPLFSASMHPHLVALSSEEERSGDLEAVAFFLGDLTESNPSDSESLWKADEVVIDLDSKGEAHFFWSDEAEHISSHVNSLLGAMLTRLKPLRAAVEPFVLKARRKINDF